MKKTTQRTCAVSCLTLGLLVAACSTATDNENPLSRGEGPSGGDTASPGEGNSDTGGDATSPQPGVSGNDGETFAPLDPFPNEGSGEVDGGSGPGEACASTSAAGELQELALAIAFDVSGSMGEGDKPYHSKELKWDPVVAASDAFFQSADVSRVSASMVFFPVEDDDRCDVEFYSTPDVQLQALPSAAFGEAIAEITPDRGGTPTLAVLQATIDYVQGLKEAGSTAKHAIVLITDGMPQGCDEEADSVENVADAVAQVSEEIPVYVIGIANPVTEEEPNPPDNVSDLHRIAAAGGTDQAFLIDTGDPTQTTTDFADVIQSIRSQGLSCELTIPAAPSGMQFDKDKVNVSLAVGASKTELVYSADCSDAAAWHYDDATNPSKIVLCEETCDVTKTLADSSLQVEFGCQRRIGSVK